VTLLFQRIVFITNNIVFIEDVALIIYSRLTAGKKELPSFNTINSNVHYPETCLTKDNDFMIHPHM